MAEIGAKTGVFESKESEMISSLLHFNEVVAENIMTPRTVMVAASEAQKISEFLEQHPSLRFSRIPIYQADDRDQSLPQLGKSALFGRARLVGLVHVGSGGGGGGCVVLVS
jgi:Mg2+/Co2+ transporter CorB